MRRPLTLPIPLPRLSLRHRARRLRRSRVAWWVASALVALLGGVQLSALDRGVQERRQAWGESVTIAVARRDLAPGHVVQQADVTLDERPRATVPAGAVTTPPAGRTVTAPVLAGEALVAARLAPVGLSGVAALVPPGHRAIAVASSSSGYGTDAPPMVAGDRVDLLATFEVLGDGGPPTAAVAEAALVVHVTESTVTVAVDEAEITRVAFAVARGTVTLALVGAG